MKKRLFLAIELPETTREYYAAISSKISAGRRTKIENYHITVLFIGQIEEDEIKDLQETIVASLQTITGFTLQPERVGYFPESHPTMAWVYYHQSQEFENLVATLRIALQHYRRESKKNHSTHIIPHTTLAYTSAIEQDFCDLRLNRVQNIFIDELVLYESVSQIGGSAYHQIARFSLKYASKNA